MYYVINRAYPSHWSHQNLIIPIDDATIYMVDSPDSSPLAGLYLGTSMALLFILSMLTTLIIVVVAIVKTGGR